MRDAFEIEGQKISHMNKSWEVGKVYLVPDNPQLYVQLKRNGISMNVQLKDITQELVKSERLMLEVSNIL